MIEKENYFDFLPFFLYEVYAIGSSVPLFLILFRYSFVVVLLTAIGFSSAWDCKKPRRWRRRVRNKPRSWKLNLGNNEKK